MPGSSIYQFRPSPREKELQKNPQIFLEFKIKIIIPLIMARAHAEAILNGQAGQAHRFSGYWPSAVLRAMASTTSGLSSR